MPQLDGLRALAVTCVMAFHFIPWVNRYAPLGTMGVRLFFVISGFLITGILLTWRGQPLDVALKTFYARRAAEHRPGSRHVRLARDVSVERLLLRSRDWHGSVSHLWSLAVEEQFYLLWPLLILCAPERWLRPAVIAMVVIAPVSRLLFPSPMDSVLPTSCLDSLGLGALLAIDRWALAPHKGAPYWIGATLVAATLLLRYAGVGGQLQVVALDFGVALLSAWIVGRAASGFAGVPGRVLS